MQAAQAIAAARGHTRKASWLSMALGSTEGYTAANQNLYVNVRAVNTTGTTGMGVWGNMWQRMAKERKMLSCIYHCVTVIFMDISKHTPAHTHTHSNTENKGAWTVIGPSLSAQDVRAFDVNGQSLGDDVIVEVHNCGERVAWGTVNTKFLWQVGGVLLLCTCWLCGMGEALYWCLMCMTIYCMCMYTRTQTHTHTQIYQTTQVANQGPMFDAADSNQHKLWKHLFGYGKAFDANNSAKPRVGNAWVEVFTQDQARYWCIFILLCVCLSACICYADHPKSPPQ